jgi:hypothetical protein
VLFQNYNNPAAPPYFIIKGDQCCDVKTIACQCPAFFVYSNGAKGGVHNKFLSAQMQYYLTTSAGVVRNSHHHYAAPPLLRLIRC